MVLQVATTFIVLIMQQTVPVYGVVLLLIPYVVLLARVGFLNVKATLSNPTDPAVTT
jgi:hypothetical protein